MPELPEVESTRRFLEPDIVGKRIVDVEVRRPRMVRRQPNPADFAGRLTGRTVRKLGRHGKFLLAELSRDLVWVTHLGMSGRIRIGNRSEPEDPHTNVVVRFGSQVDFRFIDPRTFGFVAVYTPDELASSPLALLGPDAFTATPSGADLAAALAGRTAPIKALLLDQRLVAGVGNIYADEALFRAGIDPRREGGTLTEDECAGLSAAIADTLADGLRWNGTSLSDMRYLLPDGRAGEFAARLSVYGREHEPCASCGTPIQRTVIRQRSTHLCPVCQV